MNDYESKKKVHCKCLLFIYTRRIKNTTKNNKNKTKYKNVKRLKIFYFKILMGRYRYMWCGVVCCVYNNNNDDSKYKQVLHV